MNLIYILLAPLLLMMLLAVPAGTVRYLRYRSIPHYAGPVFPHHASEAAQVVAYWQKHTQHITLQADVRLADGSVLRDVGFEPHSMVAITYQNALLPANLYRRVIEGILVLGEEVSEATRQEFAQGE